MPPNPAGGTILYLRGTAVRDGSRGSRRSPVREAAAVPTGTSIITEPVRWMGLDGEPRVGLDGEPRAGPSVAAADDE
jgi:hypothetical protein